MTLTFDEILDEMRTLGQVCETQQYKDFVAALAHRADNYPYLANVIGLGAGRMGYSLRAFIMRLSHMGAMAYFIGDTSLPRIDKHDCVVVNSSSGETPTMVLYAQQAKEAGAVLFVVTSNGESTLAQMADHKLVYPSIQSKQIMKTVYEQFTLLLFDKIASDIRDLTDHNNPTDIEEISRNHSILE